MQNKSTSVIEPGVFADPTVDYAFKRIFGTERFKEATIGLLNSIIKEHTISDVSFLNVEMPRETKNGKKGETEYNLASTYIIAFCCFDTNAFLSDLTHFTKTLDESMTEEDFWLFCSKRQKEIIAYEQDMTIDRDIRNGMKEARAEGKRS